MSNVFDTDLDEATVDAPEDESAPEAPAAENGEVKEKKAKRPPPPEGFVTPVGFAHLLNDQRSDTTEGKLPPQHVYGWLRTNKTFPNDKHPETGSPIVPIEEGLAWYDELQARKAERVAKKAAAAAAATPEEAGEDTPSE
jgi:hypothetical protein